MNINTLWFLCLVIRACLMVLAGRVAVPPAGRINLVLTIILIIMGVGFGCKALTGSNDETQVSKVFWHESRLAHCVLFILAAFYVHIANPTMSMIILSLDIILSILYRETTDR